MKFSPDEQEEDRRVADEWVVTLQDAGIQRDKAEIFVAEIFGEASFVINSFTQNEIMETIWAELQEIDFDGVVEGEKKTLLQLHLMEELHAGLSGVQLGPVFAPPSIDLDNSLSRSAWEQLKEFDFQDWDSRQAISTELSTEEQHAQQSERDANYDGDILVAEPSANSETISTPFDEDQNDDQSQDSEQTDKVTDDDDDIIVADH